MNVRNPLQSLHFRLSTPSGRRQIRRRLNYLLWPLLRGPARLYRSTFLRRSKIVTVIGSYGKTTTTRAAHRAAGMPYPEAGLSNSFSSRALALLSLGPGAKAVIEEVGIGALGQMAQYAHMFQPDVVVVTSIGSEHGRSLGTLQDTAAEKAKMLEAIRPGGIAIMNGDDPNVRAMAAYCRENISWFGVGPENDIRAEAIHLDWPNGTRFRLVAEGSSHDVSIRLIGEHGVRAALGGFAIARALGHSIEQAIAGLETMPQVANRLQVKTLKNGAHILDDCFKASLETFETAIEIVADIPARRRFLAIGAIEDFPGSQPVTYRDLGLRAGRYADRIVALLSRRSFRSFASGARTSGMSDDQLVRVTSIAEMTELLRNELLPRDVVLLKGRGSARMERVALGLQGHWVGCTLKVCGLTMVFCRDCEHLESGFRDTLPPGSQ